ncbi:MAG: CAP domain-containing protein [Pyrobaculum sp.]
MDILDLLKEPEVERCLGVEVFLEAEELRRKLPALEDWQIVSRVSYLTRVAIDSARSRGCDGVEVAKKYIPLIVYAIGINRWRHYRAYLHGTRDDVLDVLYEVFPALAPLRRPFILHNGDVVPVLSIANAGDTFSRCFPREAYANLVVIAREAKKLEDWQLVSRVASVIHDVIDKSPCNGVETARTYIPALLEEVGIDRFRPYRAYLHGIRDDVLQVLKEAFPFLRPLYRPVVMPPAQPAARPAGAKPKSAALRKAVARIGAVVGAVLFALFPILLYLLASLPTNNAFFSADSPADFVNVVIATLNDERMQRGIPPVSFMNLSVAWFKAQYMATNDYLSHYDKEGRHPEYYYTLLDGGLYAVEENIYLCQGSGCGIDGNRAASMVQMMIKQDADSDWGHRDSLLDPCNNYVAVGVARNGSSVYATVYMIAKWVEWVAPPRYENGVFYAKGFVQLPPSLDGKYYEVFIYRSVPDPANYKDSYSLGDPYAYVAPADFPYRYEGLRKIEAQTYAVAKTSQGWLFEIRFNFKPPDGAIYTLVVKSAPTGVDWAPLSPWGKARLKSCDIVTYVLGAR